MEWLKQMGVEFATFGPNNLEASESPREKDWSREVTSRGRWGLILSTGKECGPGKGWPGCRGLEGVGGRVVSEVVQ